MHQIDEPPIPNHIVLGMGIIVLLALAWGISVTV